MAKAEEQEKLLEESNNELEERRMRAEQLRRELEEKEVEMSGFMLDQYSCIVLSLHYMFANVSKQQERLDIEEKYTSLQEEAQGKTKKLKKVWTMLMAAKSEVQ